MTGVAPSASMQRDFCNGGLCSVVSCKLVIFLLHELATLLVWLSAGSETEHVIGLRLVMPRHGPRCLAFLMIDRMLDCSLCSVTP